MGKPDTTQQHGHRPGEGRRDYYLQKQSDKLQHKGTSSGGKNDSRMLKPGVIAQIPGAIRVCGDWSEQLSSNGKLYFFNIKSKSSQWERPKEWSNSRAIDVKKEKSKLQHNRASQKHSSDGSSSGHVAANKSHKVQHTHNLDVKKFQNRQRTVHDSHGNKEFRDRDYRTSNSNVKDRDYRDQDYRDKRLPESHHSGNHIDSLKLSQTQDRDYRSNNSVREVRRSVSRQASDSMSHGRGRGQTDNCRHDSMEAKESDLTRERSKSSSSTPSSSQEAPKAASVGMEMGGSADATGLVNGDGSSALVQTLSSVLNQANKTSCEDKTDPTSLEGNLKNALQMLLNAAAQNQQISGTPENPESSSTEPPHSKKPRLAQVIDEHISHSFGISKSAEKALENLRSFYNERYTNHVQGWPADQMERQSVRLCDENHQFMVNHTSQLSSSLKVARSLVRSAEINSTIQEQRVLYLRQQVKDLEKATTATTFT